MSLDCSRGDRDRNAVAAQQADWGNCSGAEIRVPAGVPRGAASAIARTPASLVCSRWSAESAPKHAASAAPFESANWSACSFTQVQARAASSTRRVCREVKAALSQTRSTASASFASATAGSISRIQVDVRVRATLIFRRQRMRAEEAGLHRDRANSPSSRATRSISSRPPCPAIAGFDFERGHAFVIRFFRRAEETRISSISEASRVALAVDATPPPERAIASGSRPASAARTRARDCRRGRDAYGSRSARCDPAAVAVVHLARKLGRLTGRSARARPRRSALIHRERGPPDAAVFPSRSVARCALIQIESHMASLY